MSNDQQCHQHCDVDELLAPFRQQVKESGMTDEELTEFGESLRREVRQLKAEKKAERA